MKRCRLTYDEWKCILSKHFSGKRIHSELFEGYIGLIEIMEVDKAQVWNFDGEDIVFCDAGRKWLILLPRNEYYCITALMDEQDNVLLWYIDMIAGQGTGEDGIPYFDDLYLDLIVSPSGTIVVDDRDELEDALSRKDITQEQFALALHTCDALQNGMLSDMAQFMEYTQKCYKLLEQ